MNERHIRTDLVGFHGAGLKVLLLTNLRGELDALKAYSLLPRTENFKQLLFATLFCGGNVWKSCF